MTLTIILYIILQIIKAMKRRVIMNEYTESFRVVEGNYEIIMKQDSELHTDLINIYYKWWYDVSSRYRTRVWFNLNMVDGVLEEPKMVTF